MRPKYNYYVPNQNMYYTYKNSNRSDDRFLGGGILAPLLVGGIAGYAIGNNNGYNNNCCPVPMYFVPANNQPFPPMYYSSSNNYYY